MQESELEKLAMEVESELGFKPIIEATIGNYPLYQCLLSRPGEFPAPQSCVIDGAIDKTTKEAILTKLSVDKQTFRKWRILQFFGNESILLQFLELDTQIRRKFAMPGSYFGVGGQFDWLCEAVLEGKQNGLDHFEEEFLGRGNWHLLLGSLDDSFSYKYNLDQIKGLGLNIPTNDEIIASRKKTLELMDPEIAKDMVFLYKLGRMSNMKGPPIYGRQVDMEYLRNFISKVSTSKHGLEDNLALGVSAGYNGVNVYGTTDMFFIPELQKAFPQDFGKVLRLYLHRLDKSRDYIIESSKERYEQGIDRVKQLLK